MAKKLGEKARKRREERAAKAPIDPSGVADATIRKHCLRAAELKASVDKAQGEYRAALKAAKSDGVDPGVVTWYLRTKKRELQEVDFETRQRNRVAIIMKLPIGVQLGLFDNGKTVASIVEGEQIDGNAKAEKKRSTKATIKAATEAGKKAGAAGHNMEHDHEDGSPEALAFEGAWKEAQAALAQKTFGATGAPAGSA
jgi:hypothetical protein